MGDFFIAEDRDPSGPCIWEDCPKPAIAVLRSSKMEMSMHVCAEHAAKFLDAEIVHDGGENIGVSIAGTIDQDEVN